MNVIGYTRVSTEEQQLSPHAQTTALHRWCEANRAVLVDTFHDHGISGSTTIDRRPGFLAALEAAKTCGADILLIAKRDRLARDVIIAATAEQLARKAGVSIVTADGAGNGDDPNAWLFRTILDAMAQYERALIRQRFHPCPSRPSPLRSERVPYALTTLKDKAIEKGRIRGDAQREIASRGQILP